MTKQGVPPGYFSLYSNQGTSKITNQLFIFFYFPFQVFNSRKLRSDSLLGSFEVRATWFSHDFLENVFPLETLLAQNFSTCTNAHGFNSQCDIGGIFEMKGIHFSMFLFIKFIYFFIDSFTHSFVSWFINLLFVRSLARSLIPFLWLQFWLYVV